MKKQMLLMASVAVALVAMVAVSDNVQATVFDGGTWAESHPDYDGGSYWGNRTSTDSAYNPGFALYYWLDESGVPVDSQVTAAPGESFTVQLWVNNQSNQGGGNASGSIMIHYLKKTWVKHLKARKTRLIRIILIV